MAHSQRFSTVTLVLLFATFLATSNSDKNDDDLLIVDETESVPAHRTRRGNIKEAETSETVSVSVSTDGTTEPSDTYVSNAAAVGGAIRSTLYALWMTPFEVFDFSNNPLENDILNPKTEALWSDAMDAGELSNEQEQELVVNQLSDVFVPSMIHRSLSHYALNAYYRFISDLSSHQKNSSSSSRSSSFSSSSSSSPFASIVAELDAKATINDKWFHVQKYYFNHRNESLYSSAAGSQFVYDEMFPRRSYDVMKRGLYLVLMDYLQRCNALTQEIHEQIYKQLFVKDDLFIWATVHNDGTKGHAMHFHEESVVSGVYYTQMPLSIRKGEFRGGRLSLHDPRMGGVYPFDGRFLFTPTQGQMILFPGWVVHHVEPVYKKSGAEESAQQGTGNDMEKFHLEDRVSFAFNIKGDWADLTDLSMIFSKTHRIKT